MYQEYGKPAAEHLSRSNIEHEHKTSFKLTDKKLVCRIDNTLTPKTSKEDNELTAFELKPQIKEPTPAAQQHIDAMLQMISQNHDETDEQLAQRQQQQASS